ncbi:hypothetical protein C8234_06700, partial [Paracidovorax avenae]
RCRGDRIEYAASGCLIDATTTLTCSEFHKASFLQRITHPSFKMPYVVRLYRIEPKTLLGQSEVVDLWLN